MLNWYHKWFPAEKPPAARNAAHARDVADAFRLEVYMRETLGRLELIKTLIHKEASKGGYELCVEEELGEAITEGLRAEGYVLEPVLVPSQMVYEFSTAQPRLDIWTKIKWGKDA
jgi:hypothetical protein